MKKYRIIFVFLILIISFSAVFVYAKTDTAISTSSDAQTSISQLQEQIKALQAQITDLQNKLSVANQEIVTVKEEIKLFARNLQKGLNGDDVKQLQEFLKQYPDIYPEGLVTGYFGSLTETAVKKWQEKQGIRAVGVVGPKTKEKLNELLAEGAGKSGNVPPGLITVQGIQETIPTIAPAGSVVSIATSSEGKIIICHYPLGNPENKQTIAIGTSAWEVHKAHGDTLGECLTPIPPVACLADAKLCPDGSYSSRIPPNCEFAACPTTQYSIIVVSPNGGETWPLGSTQSIRWTSNIPATHKIIDVRLRDSAGVEHYLLNYTPNDGIEQIIVPTTLATGAYFLEIKTALGNQTVFDKSDATFNIVASTPCTESWRCGSWSACVNNAQTRTCTDTNNCGTTNSKPILSQNCTPAPYCGDQSCNNSETCISCPSDCGICPPTTDTTPPVISNIQTSGITGALATITWTTNELADSQVEYGLTLSYGNTTMLDSSFVASHSASLTGLSSGITYHYKVKSKDAAGNIMVSADQIFTTATPSPTPTIPGVVTISGKWIDYFTKNPVESVVNSQVRSNSSGEFAVSVTTAEITTATPKAYASAFTCYSAQGFSLRRNSDGSLTAYIQANPLTGGAYQTIPITAPEVRFADVPLWPAVQIQVNTDVPAKFNIWTSPSTGAGVVLFKNVHILDNAFMLESDPYVRLTDAAGNIFVSPAHRTPLSYGCKPQVLSYYGGVFKWEEYPLDFDPVGYNVYYSGDSNLRVGTAYNYRAVGVSGGVAPYTWSIVTGDLPPGITFSQSGSFGGAPTQTGTYSAMLKAVDANGVSNALMWTLTVSPAQTALLNSQQQFTNTSVSLLANVLGAMQGILNQIQELLK